MGVSASMHVYAPLYAHGGRKKASDPPELQLQTILDCHVSAGVWPQVFWKKQLEIFNY